jgi:ferredoxin
MLVGSAGAKALPAKIAGVRGEGMALRQIVRIDEARCNGCGECVTPCLEGAIVLVNGKAKVLREELCDGAGFCLGICPTGALSVELRDAPEFDSQAAAASLGREDRGYIAQTCFLCGHGEDERVLVPCRRQGKSLWVCTRCLPDLIHGR